MKKLNRLLLAGTSVCMLHTAPNHAQDTGDSLSLEEIVVTARKREESLMDVPVSTSVISSTLIDDAGITDLYDLFEMIPGLHYDEEEDRLAALPSIRGVQANDVASNRTKVTPFIDGIPVLGSVGSIGFNGFQQVEVYRGPQSAAFGRSTFAGAINYVTRDPGEEFAGELGLNYSDYGTQILDVNLDIPIADNLGLLISAQHEDSGTPSEFHATGNYGYKVLDGIETNLLQSDGTEFGARTGENISGKLVFEPTDDLRLAMTFSHVATDDQQATRHFLSEQARNDCFNQGGLFALSGMMAPYLVGEMNCDWDDYRELYVQHNVEAFLEANPPLLDWLVDNAIRGVNSGGHPAAPFTLSDGTVLSVEEQILMMAKAYSVPEGSRGTESERGRYTLKADKLFDNGSALEFSFMQSEETFLRAQAQGHQAFFYYDPDNIGIFDDGIPNTYDNSPGPAVIWEGPDARWRILSGMAWPRLPQPSTGEIDEQYAEVRWVSPGENRLRYVVGASFYNYGYLEERWFNSMGGNEPMAYPALLNGIVDEFMQLSGFGPAGVPYAADNEIIGEDAENSAAFFNVGYDLTDRLTFSVEGRYQSDTVGATNHTTGLSAEVTTESFVPRVSLSFNPTDDATYYVQFAKGTNPAGINIGVLSTDTLNVLNDGVEYGLIPYSDALNADVLDNATGADGADGVIDAYDNINDVWYTDGTRTTPLTGSFAYRTEFTSSDFISYDEEEMNQLEFGFKGNLLDGRLTYAGAIYMINWKDQIQNGSIDLSSPCESGGDVGDPAPLQDCFVNGSQYFWVADPGGTNVDTGLNLGDVNIRGLEIEGNYRISSNWTLRAQASVLEAKYDQYCDIALFGATNLEDNPQWPYQTDYRREFNLAIREPGEGDTLTSTCYVTDGNDVAGQPRITGSISPNFATDFAGMRFSARLDFRHEGSQYDNSANFNSYPAATTANLSLGLSDDQWSATVYVNNLTGENSPRRVFGAPDAVSQMGLIGSNLELCLVDFLGNDVCNNDPRLNNALRRDSFAFQPRNPRTVGLRAFYRF